MVEVHSEAAPLIDVRATERLMELETADVDVPAPPALGFRPPLYFRILSMSQASLRVELWELGQPRGARSVSAIGSDNLKARRIALAAAELARRLRQQRLAEIRAAEEQPKEVLDEKARRGGVPIYGRLTWSAGADAASLGVNSAWVVGPALDAALRFSSGPRFALGAAWLAGDAPAFGSSATARWAEVRLGVSDAFPITGALGVSVGLAVAMAAAHIGAPAGAASAALDGWSSRAFVNARLELELGRSLTLGLGPDIGAIVRPISATGDDGRDHRVNGLWLGGGLALTVDPEAF
jgi:hypothetical protein